jgi:hypothetical protein
MFGTFKKYFIKAAVKHIRLQKIKLVKYLYQLMHNNNKIHTFKKPSRLNKAEIVYTMVNRKIIKV